MMKTGHKVLGQQYWIGYWRMLLMVVLIGVVLTATALAANGGNHAACLHCSPPLGEQLVGLQSGLGNG